MNENCYALLTAVGDYRQMNMADLPAWKNDLRQIRDGLVNGLKFDPEQIRTVGTNGCVPAANAARAFASFRALLKEEDLFVYYFSGHGGDRSLRFSDRSLTLQSILDYVESLPARSKIVILDCCYAGDFSTDGAREMLPDETVSSYAGKGISVLASASADAVSGLIPGQEYSLYTAFLAEAMKCRPIVREGKVSLAALHSEASLYMQNWSRRHPACSQLPVFRASMGGTVYFKVADDHPYRQESVAFETEQYSLRSVRPLSSLHEKRLAAFVIPKTETDDAQLREITRDAAARIRYANVFSNIRSELQFRDTPASAVWCYFGKDESDLIHNLYFARTVWGADEAVRKKYFRESKNAVILQDVAVYREPSYEMLRRMQQSSMNTEEYQKQVRELLSRIVTLAEAFIAALQEVLNRTAAIGTVLAEYGGWIREVDRLYFASVDYEVPPDELNEWAEEVFDLAGTIQNIAFVLKQNRDSKTLSEREMWLIRNDIERYYNCLEKIKETEKTLA